MWIKFATAVNFSTILRVAFVLISFQNEIQTPKNYVQRNCYQNVSKIVTTNQFLADIIKYLRLRVYY